MALVLATDVPTSTTSRQRTNTGTSLTPYASTSTYVSPHRSSFCLALPGRPFAARSPSAARPAATQKESVLRRTPRTDAPPRPAHSGRPQQRLLAAGVQTRHRLLPRPQSGAATAAPTHRRPRARSPGAQSVKLSPSQRAELIRRGQRHQGGDGQGAGPGRQGEAGRPGRRQGRRRHRAHPLRAHLRRTARPRRRPGRPERKAGATEGVIKAVRAAIKARHHRRGRRPRPRRRPRRRKAPEPKKTRAPTGRRARWSGRPTASRRSPTRRSSAGSSTTAPRNELHVITDAATGAKLFEWQAIETGTGNTPVQRHGHRSAPRSRRRLQR